jgi:hypothetical protein
MLPNQLTKRWQVKKSINYRYFRTIGKFSGTAIRKSYNKIVNFFIGGGGVSVNGIWGKIIKGEEKTGETA